MLDDGAAVHLLWELKFRDWGLGLRILAWGRGVWSLEFGGWGLGSSGLKIWGLGFGVWGLEFGVWGLEVGVDRIVERPEEFACPDWRARACLRVSPSLFMLHRLTFGILVGCGMWGVGCGVWGVWGGVWGVGCGVWGVGCGVWSVECGVWGLGLGCTAPPCYVFGVLVRGEGGQPFDRQHALDVDSVPAERVVLPFRLVERGAQLEERLDVRARCSAGLSRAAGHDIASTHECASKGRGGGSAGNLPPRSRAGVTVSHCRPG